MKTKTLLFLALFILLFTIPAYGDWNVSSSKDEMTGTKFTFAISSCTMPTKAMEFPYQDVEAWIGVGHEYGFGREWVYIGFSESPNLCKTDIENGYNLIYARIKWDNDLYNFYLTQDWGSKFLSFRQEDIPDVISRIAKCKTMLLELNWYGQEKTYFLFQLKGSREALKKMREECSK